jgi:hypothetical protein
MLFLDTVSDVSGIGVAVYIIFIGRGVRSDFVRQEGGLSVYWYLVLVVYYSSIYSIMLLCVSTFTVHWIQNTVAIFHSRTQKCSFLFEFAFLRSP